MNKNLKIKKSLSAFLTVVFLLSQSFPCFSSDAKFAAVLNNNSLISDEQTNSAPTTSEQQPQPEAATPGKAIQGQVDYSELNEHKDLFTGQIESVQKGSKLKMTVSKVINSNFYMKGDEFFAEITDDFSTKSGIVLPSGTVAHGTVTELSNKKRMGRDAYMTIKFDYLITPDNRKIPIQASMTTKRNAAASAAKVVLEDTAYTVAGGVIGGVLAFRILGLGAAVASHGYTVAGGAGIGALVGITASLIRKGNDVLIQPGDEIKVNVNESLNLPVMSEKALKDEDLNLDGLDVRILKYTVEKDPFGELNTITLTLDIKNNTDKTFSTFDMALLSDYKTVYYASPFGDTSLWFTKISPNSETRGNLSFSVDNPKKRHWLVFYDTRTRKPLAKFSLKNAERELKKGSKNK